MALANRLVMAPMTRNRAAEDGTVPPMMVAHYRERADAGLIITESVPVSPQAVGYPLTPGIYPGPQAASWVCLTNAVHSAGGRFSCSFSIAAGSLTPASSRTARCRSPRRRYARPGRPSRTRACATSPPRGRWKSARSPGLVAQFQDAAEMARRAGFDGVEVYGGNGYLIDQLLRDGSNRRTDRYGGNAPN